MANQSHYKLDVVRPALEKPTRLSTSSSTTQFHSLGLSNPRNAADLSSNFTEKNFKSKVQGTQSLHIRNVSDPQLQILHFWSPSRSPTSSKLECREKCKLLGPRHLITADLQWFGPPTNDFTFFRPSSQQGLTGIVALYKASTQGFSLDNASTRIS